MNDEIKGTSKNNLGERYGEIKKTRTRIREYRMEFHRMVCRIGAREIIVKT